MLRVSAPYIITSPIAPLVEWIPHALVNVAPELAAELNQIVDGYTLDVIEEPRWICSATPPTKTFRISTRVIEILWAQSYAAFMFYTREMNRRGADGVVAEITDPETLEALELYRWALERMIDDAPTEWPAQLPRPTPARPGAPVTEAGAGDVAREFALIATGFLLLHEVAHISLKHTGNSASEWSIDEERDADAWAAEWVLARGQPPLDQLDKRALGVSMALLMILARGVHTGEMNGVTHPRDFDRLYNALAHRIPPELDRVWWMVTGILSLHLTAKGLMPDGLGPFDSAYDAANAIIDHIAGLYERGAQP